jgi:outer membrane protein assembly factor BamE (lipoprotein component of BamABCDE complex)
MKILLLMPFLFLSGCVTLPEPITDYFPPLHMVNKSTVSQLKVGMSKTEVWNLIDSPSIAFDNQWIYIHVYNHPALDKKDNINYQLTLTFNKDKLMKIDGLNLDSLPPPP